MSFFFLPCKLIQKLWLVNEIKRFKRAVSFFWLRFTFGQMNVVLGQDKHLIQIQFKEIQLLWLHPAWLFSNPSMLKVTIWRPILGGPYSEYLHEYRYICFNFIYIYFVLKSLQLNSEWLLNQIIQHLTTVCLKASQDSVEWHLLPVQVIKVKLNYFFKLQKNRKEKIKVYILTIMKQMLDSFPLAIHEGLSRHVNRIIE